MAGNSCLLVIGRIYLPYGTGIPHYQLRGTRDNFIKSGRECPSKRYFSMFLKIMGVKLVVLVNIQLSIEASRETIYGLPNPARK